MLLIFIHATTPLKTVQKKLHNIGFTPRVFKKASKDKKSKGVDIALATDVLSNAYNDNFDVVVLVAGDGDYKPLVEEIKHLGKVVYLNFFLEKKNGLSEELCLTSDRYFDFSKPFIQGWQAHYPA
ncbi:MAG: NYN domain-containing protein [Synechococcales bacterium]|nr:NYN domain-containing protein [Synechococcales bacterium]